MTAQNPNTVFTQDFINTCKSKLLELKMDLLNRARVKRFEFAQNDKNTGDEIDQSVAQINEFQLLSTQERLRVQLMEIENALRKIEVGAFGICEETDEVIEKERLLAIPYTRLSIEGAELREDLKKKFAAP